MREDDNCPDMCTRKKQKALTEIRQRIKSHPEEANKTSDMYDRFKTNIPKYFVGLTDLYPSVLHMVVCQLPLKFPIEVIDELIRAFPAAVSCRSKVFPTPLGLLFRKDDEDLSCDSHTGQLARLLMRRMITPPSTEIANGIPSVPADIVERNIFPYLGDPLTQLDSDGCSILMRLLHHRWGLNFTADDMIHHILDVVPKSASPIPSFPKQQPLEGLFPIHVACLKRCSIDIIRKLITAYPGALTIKAARGVSTPLHIICSDGEAFELIRLLIESGPGALSMIDKSGLTPLHYALSHLTFIDASCIRLITRLNPQAFEIPEQKHGNLPLHFACQSFRKTLWT